MLNNNDIDSFIGCMRNVLSECRNECKDVTKTMVTLTYYEDMCNTLVGASNLGISYDKTILHLLDDYRAGLDFRSFLDILLEMQKCGLREENDILTIVRKYVWLKNSPEWAGKLYFGYCPFHNGSNTDFRIDPDSQTFTCVECGLSGNVNDFLKLIGDNNVSKRE